MTTLLFARHGQASFGKKDYDKLSTLGMQQAYMLGRQYAQSKRAINAVISGSLLRQRESADHFLKGYLKNNQTQLDHTQSNFTPSDQHSTITPTQPVTVIESLNEYNHEDIFIKYNPKFNTVSGVLEAIGDALEPEERLAELFQNAMVRWHSGDHDADYLESWPVFNERVKQALQDVMQHAKRYELETVLVFTSGGVIAALTAHLLGQGSLTAHDVNKSLVNTGVTSIQITNQKPRLLSLNEHSHLYDDGENYLTWR